MGFSRYAPGGTQQVRTGEGRDAVVRRTNSLVFGSVIATMFGNGIGLTSPAVLQAVAAHPFLTMLAAFAPLFLAGRMRDVFPQNIGLVFLFAFAMGLIMSPLVYVLETRQPGVVGQAGILTLSSFGVLTAYAWLSRRDFSAWGGFFVTGLWVLIATSLLNLFFQNQTANLWIAGATVFVFSGLLVFDTWRIRNVYGPDDYVLAAVNIYLDLLNMFMAILSFAGRRRN